MLAVAAGLALGAWAKSEMAEKIRFGRAHV